MNTMRLRPASTTVWGYLVTVCGLVLLVRACPAVAQTIDTSGLDLFWRVADRLSSGEEFRRGIGTPSSITPDTPLPRPRASADR
jgi:hypothetical protein